LLHHVVVFRHGELPRERPRCILYQPGSL
jgi:hypothetical protein